MAYSCFLCHVIITGAASQLLQHLHSAHALYDGKGLLLHCDQGGCPATFSTFNSFRKHLVRLHQQQGMGYPNQPQNAVFVNVENDCPFDVAEPGQDNFEIDQEEINDDNNTFLEKMKMQAAMFIGTMLSDRNMTHASIQRVVNAVTDLTSNTLTLLKTRMQSVLTGFDVDLSTPQCERLFSLFEAVENPFLGLETLYKQEKYFEEDFRILKPKTVALGIRYDTITDSDIEGHISVRFCHKNIGNDVRTAACKRIL